MILHIDMDAFFASVEQLDNPAYRGRCVIVGGTSSRGVVAAASYEARRFGVRSAMPLFQARKLCPQAILVRPRKDRYKEVSCHIMAILETFTPLVEPVSIDEAFLDVTGCRRIYGPPEEIARRIKAAVRDQMALTCSVGVAPVKFLAKIASDMDKPDGLTVIRPEEVPALIEKLPLSRVPGVGPAALECLTPLGVHTLGDVRGLNEAQLERRLGKFGLRLAALARGDDRSPVAPPGDPKSISAEQTLAEDTADRADLTALLLAQAAEVARQLRRKGFRARTVVLKLKHDDFCQATRSRTLESPTQSATTIHQAAVGLLAEYRLARPVRLVGVGAAGLVPAGVPVQADLFDGARRVDAAWEKVERAVDGITARFGTDAVRRASQQGKDDR